MKKIKSLKIAENPESIKALWAQALSHRNLLLQNSDWTQIPNSGLSESCVDQFKIWRQKLRKIRANSSIPVNAVVNTTKVLATQMPKIEWKDEPHTEIDYLRYSNKKSASTIVNEITNYFNLDYQILQMDIKSLLDYDEGFKKLEDIQDIIQEGQTLEDLAAILYNREKVYKQTLKDIKLLRDTYYKQVDITTDTGVLYMIHHKFLEDINGYRHRLLETFSP